jgi:hypothetical protein
MRLNADAAGASPSMMGGSADPQNLLQIQCFALTAVITPAIVTTAGIAMEYHATEITASRGSISRMVTLLPRRFRDFSQIGPRAGGGTLSAT